MLYKIRFSIAVLIFILSILGVTGVFYPIKIFNIQLIPLLERTIIDFSIIAAIMLSVILLSALISGRIYCSLICPLGILQEIISTILRKENENKKSYPVKYFILAISIGFLAAGSSLIIKYIDSYTIFSSSAALSLTGIITIIIVCLIVIFKNRFFCTDICPVGTLLGLISKISLFKMYINKDECLSCAMCETSCPTGSIDSENGYINNETCIKCFKCINSCAKDTIKFGIKPPEKPKFNITRRKFIISSAVLITFLGAYRYGIKLTEKSLDKLKNIILPPGALNAKRMLDTCLNCNLCVNICPGKIIKKANKDFNAVHIDYSDRGSCKFRCHKCSQVCPSGAIRKISLEEKQKTKIATAKINKENCILCRSCISSCPVHAISCENNESIVIDSSKCIGCGRCLKRCHYDAINIFAVNEQKVI